MTILAKSLHTVQRGEFKFSNVLLRDFANLQNRRRKWPFRTLQKHKIEIRCESDRADELQNNVTTCV
jgi:hypothetical protein